MTYEELVELLKMKQAAPQGAAPSLNEIIAGIQGQYQPVQNMPMQSMGQGAQRFITGAQDFGPIEQMTEYGRQPVSQSSTPMTRYVPGAFDINKTAYFVEPSEAQIAARMGQGGSDSQTAALSPQQEAFFNFLESPEGRSYKDARGAAMSNVIGSVTGMFNPVAAAYNFFTGQPNIGTSISKLSAADRAAFEAAKEALINYGVSSTAMGPTTAAQAQAIESLVNYGVSPTAMGPTTAQQAQALIDQFVGPIYSESYSPSYSDPSQSYSGGDTTSASSAESTASDNSGVGGW